MPSLSPTRLLAITFVLFILAILSPRPAQSAAALQELPTTVEPAQPSLDPAWEALTLPSGINANMLVNLVVNPADANIAYLGTHKGLYKTGDAGQSWQRIGADVLDRIFSVAVSADDEQRLYAQTWNQALYRSDDGGSSWVKFTLPTDSCDIVAAPSDANRLYARLCYKDKQGLLFRSTDGGQNWSTPPTKLDQPIDTVAVAPADAAILIAATFDKVYRSADSGETWTRLPIGTRYFGRPMFDPANPATVYLGHHTGLLRSIDGGVTWLDSGADREFATLIIGGDGSSALVGGNNKATWRFVMDAAGWRATAWDAPSALATLRRSAGDHQVIYAQNDTGLWRQRQVAQTIPFTPAAWVYLPVVQRSRVRQQAEQVFAADATAGEAIARANEYRQWIGAVALESHPAIATAAQNHATYYVVNAQDPSARAKGAHGEVAGKPHYTGDWPGDRLKAASYPWFGGSEVMHFIGDPVASVDGWMATVYHRFLVIDPNAHYAGYGMDKRGNVAADVMDFGGGPMAAGVWASASPYPLGYPANGQTGIPISWNGAETPNPLPPGTTGPVGYPFTLQPIGGKLQVDRAELRTADGQIVAVHPNPADCAKGDCYTLIAVAPLQPNTEYIAEAAGNVGGVPFQQQWRFTTSDNNVAAAGVPPELLVISEQ